MIFMNILIKTKSFLPKNLNMVGIEVVLAYNRDKVKLLCWQYGAWKSPPYPLIKVPNSLWLPLCNLSHFSRA